MSSVHAFPVARPHGIMTGTPTARARMERVPGGFMRSMMRRHYADEFDEPDQREKKATQEEQDVEDERTQKRAMKNLVNSWQERLQLISVITTFFASTEAAMLVNSKPASASDLENNILKVSNAALLGALILHVYASVLSFLGAFLLISYKLREAKREEMIMEGISVVKPPRSDTVIKDTERDAIDLSLPRTLTTSDAQSRTFVNHGAATPSQELNDGDANALYPLELPVFSANPHIEQVGSNATSHRLLSRTHAVCVFLAAVGFVLALAGILCYAWALQPREVSIFTSVCMGAAMLTAFALHI